MEEILAVRGLEKTYGAGAAAPVAALRGVDLTVRAGEFVAVVGPSGSGKSTLLHLIAGLDRPTAGEIHLGGRRVDTLSEAGRARLRRREVGVVFQAHNLIGNLTVAENVELPALLAGVGPREARRRRAALLGELGLADRGHALPGELSGGAQQRVGVARALVNRPPLLCADEPTGNLDSVAARGVVELLRRRDRGHAVVLVTHDAEVAAAAYRTVAMRDGRMA